MDAWIFNSCPRSSTSSPLSLSLLLPFCLCSFVFEGGQAETRCRVIKFSAPFSALKRSLRQQYAARTFRVKYAGTDLHKEKVVYLCVRALCVGSSDLVIKIAWAPKWWNWVLVVYGAVRQNKIMTVAAFLCLGKSTKTTSEILRRLSNHLTNPTTLLKKKKL
jgi:hypothetical protein